MRRLPLREWPNIVYSRMDGRKYGFVSNFILTKTYNFILFICLTTIMSQIINDALTRSFADLFYLKTTTRLVIVTIKGLKLITFNCRYLGSCCWTIDRNKRDFTKPYTLRNMNPEKWNILYILFTAGAQQVSMNKFCCRWQSRHKVRLRFS